MELWEDIVRLYSIIVEIEELLGKIINGKLGEYDKGTISVVGQFEIMKRDIVLIEWLDSKGMERWEYLDGMEPIPPSNCHSVGFLIEDNNDYKTIALGLSDTQVLGRTTIPAGCIKSIRKLPTSSFSSCLGLE